jgi:5'-nucleotidase
VVFSAGIGRGYLGFGLQMSTRASSKVVAASVAGLAVVTLLRWATRLREEDGVVCSPLSELILRWRLRSVDRLVIVADFDRTITSAFVDAAAGVAGSTSHGILESCSVLSPAYRAKAQSLLDKYHPIEFSATLSKEEKLPIMQEWYRQSHALLLEEHISEETIRRAVADAAASIRIRPGFAELRREAASRGIPLVVFSAGLGNVVKEVLRQCVEEGEQLPVVSNWLRFAPGGGHACGFDEPLVHMFNKDGARLLEQLGEAEWRAISRGRDTALLLGDGLGDCTMADGLGMRAIARFGWLNELTRDGQQSRLPKYMAAYDAVVLADGPMDWLLHLLFGARP